MTRTNDITSSTEYRTHQKDFHARIHSTGRPLFITNRGKTEAVVLSPEAYDDIQDLMELRESLASITRSEQQLADGKGMEALESLKRIAAAHSLKLNR